MPFLYGINSKEQPLTLSSPFLAPHAINVFVDAVWTLGNGFPMWHGNRPIFFVFLFIPTADDSGTERAPTNNLHIVDHHRPQKLGKHRYGL